MPRGLGAAVIKKSEAYSGRTLLIAIVLAAVGALLVLGVVSGTTLRHSIASDTTITLDRYDSLRVGMNQTQVEVALGLGSGYFQPEDGNKNFNFKNADGSFAKVGFLNGAVTSLSQSGLSRSRSHRVGGIALPLFVLTSLMSILIFFVASLVCLYVAAQWRGYDLSVKQVLGIAAICSLAGLLPWFGWLASLVVLFALIQWWTDADLIETFIIVFLSRVLVTVVAVPFALGIGMGFHL